MGRKPLKKCWGMKTKNQERNGGRGKVQASKFDDVVDETRRKSRRTNTEGSMMDKAVNLAKKKNLEGIANYPIYFC
jgi:hypothetical protein